MRKTICFVLILCIIFSLSLVGCTNKFGNESTTLNSETVQVKEVPASDFEYSVNEEAVAIKQYIGTDKTVAIPEKIAGKPVTVIFTSAFMNQSIEKVVIPSTVTLIWESAFANCSSLKEVVFGDGITEIMPQAFQDCTALTEVKLPKNLEKLGGEAFKDCTSLKKVFIPKSVTQMGMEVFLNCAVSEFVFEDGIKKIGSYAAFWCGDNLKTVTIPASVEEIRGYSFDNKLEKAVFLGDAPKKLGDHSFAENTVIYYKKGTSGWEDTALRDICTLIERS